MDHIHDLRKVKLEINVSIGERLKEERQRLGKSQTDFAGLAGASKGAQAKWENDTTTPNAQALAAYADAGADILYIVTGRRTPDRSESVEEEIREQLDDIERELLHNYHLRKSGEDPEQAEAALMTRTANTLRTLLQADAKFLTPNLFDRATNLLDIVGDPLNLSLFRAADYAQKKKRRDQIKESLGSWLESDTYEPTDAVKNYLANLALEYGVSIKALVELIELVHDDIIGQGAKAKL